jgi:hypothetical protein
MSFNKIYTILLKHSKLLIINFLPIFVFSPLIDHLFGPLIKNKSDYRILVEIFLHILVLTLFWEYTNIIILSKFKRDENIEDLIQGLVLFGLQKNLIDKLNYITYKNPLRLLKPF